MRREVSARDGGQCAFRGSEGRCTERAFLEFHHVVPYANGGETTVANLELRCRAHNGYEADRWFGREAPGEVRESPPVFGAGVGAEGDIRIGAALLGLGRVGHDSSPRKHVLKAMEDNEGSAFAYTVGLYHSFGHPELIVGGLPLDVGHSVLNIAGESIRRGVRYSAATQSDEFLENRACTFRGMPVMTCLSPGARRPDGKARRASILGICER